MRAWIRSDLNPVKVARISAFLRDELRLSVDPRGFAGQLRQATIELQDGLATWLAGLELPTGGALCVSAAAGSGKTLLALRWLERARAQGKAGAMCVSTVLWQRLCGPRAQVEGTDQYVS